MLMRVAYLVPRGVRRRARAVIGRMPYGDRVATRWIKSAIEDGRIGLVPVEPLKANFERAATDLAPMVDGPLVYFEAGVFAGQSLALWHSVASELCLDTRSFGADSFQGLPSAVRFDEGEWEPGAFACPRSVTEWNLRRLGAPLDRIRLIEGWFDDTLSPELAAEVGTVHIAMLDADAYSSTIPVLRFLGPLLHDPAYLIFDDWFVAGNYDPATGKTRGQGVERAFEEWLAAESGWQVEPIDTYDFPRETGLEPAGQVLKISRALRPRPRGASPVPPALAPCRSGG